MSTIQDVNAYPLHWPEGVPRTPLQAREHSRFKVTPDRARRGLLQEIDRLVLGSEARGWRVNRDLIVISTNLRLRQDGEPMMSQRPPEDTGVAVYFERKGTRLSFACDRWRTIHDNMHAISKTIEALRGIERWGATDMLERAFKGFEALPGPGTENWSQVLGVLPHTPTIDVRRAYHRLRKLHHPDHGGNAGDFGRILDAWAAFEAERGL